jgi:two-component system, NarL family, invasion response regulator UvrY
MEKPHSIFLVEDHVVVRNGLKGLVEAMGNFKVTGEFDNGKDLIALLPDAGPDVIIMDLTMPVMDGETTMKWMKKNAPDMRVLILTLDTNEQTIINLFKLGVRGYLPKTCDASVLKEAIGDIIHSGYYHNELLSNALRNEEARPRKDERSQILAQLSEREMEFLRLVCSSEELTYEEIAIRMTAHRRTIDNYRESLFEKFDIKSKTGLVLFAIKHGIVGL